MLHTCTSLSSPCLMNSLRRLAQHPREDTPLALRTVADADAVDVSSSDLRPRLCSMRFAASHPCLLSLPSHIFARLTPQSKADEPRGQRRLSKRCTSHQRFHRHLLWHLLTRPQSLQLGALAHHLLFKLGMLNSCSVPNRLLLDFA